MRIWLTSDWHLADGAWIKRPEIAGDAFRSLEVLMEKAEPEDVILAAGDLFDTKHPLAKHVARAKDLLDCNYPAVADKPTLLYLQGQHEMQTEVPWMTLVTAVGIHGDFRNEPSTRVESDNYVIDIYGLDWTLYGQLREQLKAIGTQLATKKSRFPRTAAARTKQHVNILMLHQTCNAVMAGIGDDRQKILDSLNYRACELQDGMLPPGFDLVVVGDAHYHTTFHLLDTEGRAVLCYSPGSFAMQSIAETNVGYCYAMDANTLEVESVPLYRRNYAEKKINNDLEFDQAVRDVIKLPTLAQADIPIVRYYLYGRDAERIRLLKQACADKEHPFFHVPDETTGEYIDDDTAETESIDDMVIQAIQESAASDSAKDMLTALVTNDSADEVIAAYYKDMVLSAEKTET